MKAMIWTKYGPPDVLQLAEVEKPIPKNNEVLIRIHATTVTAGDCEMRSLKFPFWLRIPIRLYAGITKPTRLKIIGQEFSGEIESVGKDVKRFKKGDRVFGTTGFAIGTYAEFVTLPETSDDGVLTHMPEKMSYEEAAAVPTGGLEALHFLRKANVKKGDHVLINGAGGSIGTFGVQLAKHLGAEVTAVDSAEKLEMLRSLGADRVIDYNREDFTHNDTPFDVIFDVIGKSSFIRSIKSLKRNGKYVLANPQLRKIMGGFLISGISKKQVISKMSEQKTEDLIYLGELIETGKIMPVIDRLYPLDRTAEAHRYVEMGHKKGNVVITFQ